MNEIIFLVNEDLEGGYTALMPPLALSNGVLLVDNYSSSNGEEIFTKPS